MRRRGEVRKRVSEVDLIEQEKEFRREKGGGECRTKWMGEETNSRKERK